MRFVPPPSEPLARRQFLRRLVIALALAGTIALVAGQEVGYPLVGVALYWTGAVAVVGVCKGSSIAVFDERDAALERRASHRALLVGAGATILGLPSVSLLSDAGVYTPPPAFDGVVLAFVALLVLFAVNYLWLRYRP